LSALFAFVIHDEGLAAVQIAGGALVLAAVVWVQAQRADLAAETVSAGGRRDRHRGEGSLVTQQRGL
jgi:hypothetical protein